VDNDASHTSNRVKEYVEGFGGRLRLHPLPAWSPQSNPVELIWWSLLHEAVSRNHRCRDLSGLLGLQRIICKRDSLSISSWEKTIGSWKGHHLEIDKCPFISCTYLDRELKARPRSARSPSRSRCRVTPAR
jgi:transposase